MNKTPEQVIIQNDIMRYKKNKLASLLAILALVFGCLYFCLLYSFTNIFFSNWKIGISVILTLLMLLLTFLSSEGIKNYNKKYCILMLVLAAVQVIRIFGIPLEAMNYDNANDASVFNGAYLDINMSEALSFTFLIVWLVASATCLVASAVIGYINCTRLEHYTKQVASGEVNVDDLLKKLDAEEAAGSVSGNGGIVDDALEIAKAEVVEEESSEQSEETPQEPEVVLPGVDNEEVE